MPTILCPHCTQPTTLPDPWPHPGYTCPHCGKAVSLRDADDTPARPKKRRRRPDPDDEPRRVEVDLHDRTRRSSVASGFGTVFGGVFGCFTAGLLIIVGLIAFAVWSCEGVQKMEEERRQKERATPPEKIGTDKR